MSKRPRMASSSFAEAFSVGVKLSIERAVQNGSHDKEPLQSEDTLFVSQDDAEAFAAFRRELRSLPDDEIALLLADGRRELSKDIDQSLKDWVAKNRSTLLKVSDEAKRRG